MNAIPLRTAVALFTALFLAAGCSTLDKAYVGTVKAVDPDQARLRQETRWLNPQPNLRLVNADQMVVFVRVRDSSGSSLDISREVRMALEDLGYRLTRDLAEAQYIINADIRYYGENAESDGGRASLTAGVGGAVIGGIIGHQSGRTGEGATIGGLATGLLFDTLANRNKVREFDVVVDVRVGERIEGGVTTTRKSSDAATLSHSGRSGGPAGIESGYTSGSSDERQQVVMEEDFLYAQNRMVAYVRSLNLAPEEAAPVLRNRMVKALANILP